MKTIILTTSKSLTAIAFASSGLGVIQVDLDHEQGENELRMALALASAGVHNELAEAENLLWASSLPDEDAPIISPLNWPRHFVDEPLTADQKVTLITELSQYVIDRTESLVPGLIGIDLAYLLGAIAKGDHIQLCGGSYLARLLAKGYPKDSPLWAHIDLEY